jgi:hypothetical protein
MRGERAASINCFSVSNPYIRALKYFHRCGTRARFGLGAGAMFARDRVFGGIFVIIPSRRAALELILIMVVGNR